MQSAAKGVTTVQEAPAIVTVVTSDEIRERLTRALEDAKAEFAAARGIKAA